jgi:hypothetical protein
VRCGRRGYFQLEHRTGLKGGVSEKQTPLVGPTLRAAASENAEGISLLGPHDDGSSKRKGMRGRGSLPMRRVNGTQFADACVPMCQVSGTRFADARASPSPEPIRATCRLRRFVPRRDRHTRERGPGRGRGVRRPRSRFQGRTRSTRRWLRQDRDASSHDGASDHGANAPKPCPAPQRPKRRITR